VTHINKSYDYKIVPILVGTIIASILHMRRQALRGHICPGSQGWGNADGAFGLRLLPSPKVLAQKRRAQKLSQGGTLLS
jgi:hypothetical protein